MTAYVVKSNIHGLSFSLTSEKDRNNFLAYFGEAWYSVNPSLGVMTLTDTVRDALNKLGYGKGCTNEIAAIKFLSSMTGASLKETNDFFKEHIW